MTKYKKGTILKSKNSSKLLKVIKPANGNGHYVCNQLNGKKQSHHVHYGTLDKFYKVVENE